MKEQDALDDFVFSLVDSSADSIKSFYRVSSWLLNCVFSGKELQKSIRQWIREARGVTVGNWHLRGKDSY